MPDFTTSQLATILSVLTGATRKPANKATALKAIGRHADTLGIGSETVLAAAPDLLEGRLDPATWRQRLMLPAAVSPRLEALRPSSPEVPQVGARDDGDAGAARGTQVTPRAGTKLALVTELLGREAGATLAELVAATGWLPHTTRAALTGLRKKGLALEKIIGAGGNTAYRILPPDRAVDADATADRAA